MAEARDANPGDPASALAGGGQRGVGFDAAGDARIASFAAVPLVAGGWAKNANAGPDGKPRGHEMEFRNLAQRPGISDRHPA